MFKKSKKRPRIECIEEVDEATSPKQPCLHDLNEVETFQDDNPLKMQYEAESLMSASGSTDYCTQQMLLYMYKLDVSTWCYLKRRVENKKLDGVGLTLDNNDVDKFSDIVIRQNDESIHVNVNYTVSLFSDKFITYLNLFGIKSPYSLKNYFNSWVSYELNKPKYQSSKIKYLVVFCNDKLELSEDNKLTLCSSKNSYPFQFESMDVCQIPVLQDMLVTNTSCKFYKFATDDQTIDEFCQRLMLSSTNKKTFNKKFLTSEFEVDLKKSFLNKLIFLDNQPCRESLKNILKDEIERNGKDYIKLQNKLIKYTSIAKKNINSENLNLLMSVLNDMFVHMNISAVKTKSYHISNVINILYKRKITYLINVGSANNARISFDDFFPKKKREKSSFSLDDLYTFFCNEYRKNSNIKFFVIYTNSELNLTHNNVIQNKKSEKYFPLKLNKIDVTIKRYKIFKNCTNLNESMLFEFASEDLDALLKLLNPPNSNEQDIDAEEENNMKLLFLHTLIIATGQKKITDILLQNEQQQLPYNFDQLQEVTLRWLEFQKHQILTLRNMRLLLNDIQNNRTNGKYLNCSDVADEWKLTKSLCRDTPTLTNEVFNFLINGKGKLFIQNFKNSGIDLRSVANVMHGVTKKNLYPALEALHNFWFDKKGNKTKNFLIYEKNHMNFKTLFTIAGKSHIHAVGIIESLFDLWFDDLGNKTKYLYSLEREGIPFSILGSMFNACGFDSRLAHENLYNLWFDEHDNKTKYIINFQKNNLSLARIAPLLHSGGISCAQILKDLHDLWFDSEGNMTKYLLTLQNHNIDFYKIKETLNGSKTQAVSLYKKMYYTLFDELGNPTQNLQNLSNAGIKFSTISKLLYSSNNNIVKLFNELYSLFFDNDGNKTVYLKTFENHNINLNDICKILKGRSADASTTFKNFYNLLFDEKEEKKFLLKTFENYGIGINQLAKMIRHSNAHAVKLLTDLFNLWFDENGNKSYYIKHFENVNVDLIKIMYFLRNAQKGTCRFFQVLYDFFINENGVESFHLNTLNKHEISIDIFLNFVRGATIDHMRTMNKVFYTFFDKEGNKTQLLCNFENKGVDIESLSIVFVLCQGNGIQKFYDFFFDETDKDRETLKIFEMRNVRLLDLCNIFLKVGSSTPLFFKMLFDLWFDENLKETQYLQDLERNGITLLWLCQILRGTGIHGYEAFKGIHKLFINEDGQATLVLQIVLKYINLKKLRNIYSRGGRVFLRYFPKLLTRWFDEKGQKTHFLLTMEKNNFNIDLICDILKASGGYADKFFMELYKLFFDPEGNPSSYINNYLNNPSIIKGVCKIIRGTRGKIINLLKRLYSLWFKSDGSKRNYLLTLENCGVDFVTIHGLFIAASYSLRNTFVNLFKCMFESISKPTESVYLKSLLGIGFTVPDIISLLRKSGPNAAGNFMNLYHLFFNEQGQMTRYAEVLTQNQVEIGSFVRGLNVKNGNKLVDIFRSAYELYYDENGVKIDAVVNDDISNIELE